MIWEEIVFFIGQAILIIFCGYLMILGFGVFIQRLTDLSIKRVSAKITKEQLELELLRCQKDRIDLYDSMQEEEEECPQTPEVSN